jgi:hypothetical protein
MAKSKAAQDLLNRTDARDIEIYKEDCEFYRHQHKLMWGRFQTIAAIEGALLYARFARIIDISFQKYILIIAGTVIVYLISWISLKNHSDAGRYLHRIREFENTLAFPKNESFQFSAFKITFIAIIVINILNILVMISFRAFP